MPAPHQIRELNEGRLILQPAPNNAYLRARWQGFMSSDELQWHLLQELSFARQHHLSAILRDARASLANPNLIQHWILEKLLPEAAAADIRLVAQVMPEAYMAQKSTLRVLEQLGDATPIEVGIFHTPVAAEVWLLERLEQRGLLGHRQSDR